MAYPTLFLKPGKEKPAATRHPWVFSGAVDADRTGTLPAGPVEVRTADGTLVGVGTHSPRSAIAARLFAFEATMLDKAFFARRFAEAAALRRDVVPPNTNAFRLVNSEGDGLPGLVVDFFASHLSIQVGTAGMERLMSEWLPALVETVAPASARLKPDQDAANREGMEAPRGPVHGDPPDRVVIEEAGLSFVVDLARGQKTGFFLDQRDNRKIVAGLARGRTVLDGFAYTGAFSAHALAAGASRAVAVESSAAAAALIEENASRPGGTGRCEIVCGDCFEFLRQRDEVFDVVVIDPPPLARRRAHVAKAARAYKDIFRLGLLHVAPGGFLLACSCSAAVDARLFQQILFSAALEAERDVRVLRKLMAAPDHPVSVFHPEGEYLKAWLLSVR